MTIISWNMIEFLFPWVGSSLGYYYFGVVIHSPVHPKYFYSNLRTRGQKKSLDMPQL